MSRQVLVASVWPMGPRPTPVQTQGDTARERKARVGRDESRGHPTGCQACPWRELLHGRLRQRASTIRRGPPEKSHLQRFLGRWPVSSDPSGSRPRPTPRHCLTCRTGSSCLAPSSPLNGVDSPNCLRTRPRGLHYFIRHTPSHRGPALRTPTLPPSASGSRRRHGSARRCLPHGSMPA